MAKRILSEDYLPNKDIYIITQRLSSKLYETEVLGGEQDGWVLTSTSKQEALDTHDNLVGFIGGKHSKRVYKGLQVIKPNKARGVIA